MPSTTFQDRRPPAPDDLSRALFASHFDSVESRHRDAYGEHGRNVQLEDLPEETLHSVLDFLQGDEDDEDDAPEDTQGDLFCQASASPKKQNRYPWTETEVVQIHWGLLQYSLRRLADPTTPLEEKLDTLAWALTEPAKDDEPFSLASCIRIVSTSPLSPTDYIGNACIEEIRDWIRANTRRWLRETVARYPDWVQDLIRSQPHWVSRQLARNPQWLNEQVKRRRKEGCHELFADQSALLAY